MKTYTIDELRRIIAPIAQEHGVEKVSLFGSYARLNATAQSDVDLKIEKGAIRSLFQLCSFRLALEDSLQLSVDVITSGANDTAFLSQIAQDEVVLYERA
ncbi:MAG: nucleotidyltransferase domain-containing protein [Butyricicoccus sp.]|nr:nucleotidyltransferase domain-containing protein [Butyricicoccus sp.]